MNVSNAIYDKRENFTDQEYLSCNNSLLVVQEENSQLHNLRQNQENGE